MASSTSRDGGERSSETQNRAGIIPARVFLVAILCGILVAGLWPFCAPVNQVNWSTVGNGIEFGRRGTGVSLGRFALRAGQDKSAGSVEVWLEPHGMAHWKTLLAFDSKEHPGSPFMLAQRADALVVDRHNIDAQGVCRTGQFTVRNVFESGLRVHVAIVLSAHHTLVYVNGAPAVDSYLIGDSERNLTGRLVLANSTEVDNSWRGEILGLAVYPERLSADQIARDYREWTGGGQPMIAEGETALALYRFNEHSGRVAHNAVDSATDLVFPERYFVLHPRFLTPAWTPFRFGLPDADYWKDVIVNFVGFLPVGFFVLNYVSLGREVRHMWLLAVAAGFLLSLTIEVLQWFLPTRDSDMTDLIVNTLGTAAGAALFRSRFVYSCWRSAEHVLVTISRGVIGFTGARRARY